MGGRLFFILPYKVFEFMASHSMKQPECALSILITLLFPSLSFSDAESGWREREREREKRERERETVLYLNNHPTTVGHVIVSCA